MLEIQCENCKFVIKIIIIIVQFIYVFIVSSLFLRYGQICTINGLSQTRTD